tara:strand:- start:430 stop:948 length:519 start_codon:yes stop_codon:yes gene_type:complete
MNPPQSAALPVFFLGVGLIAATSRILTPAPPEPWQADPSAFAEQEPASVALVAAETPPPPALDHERLYRALVEQESGGNPHAVGDGGRAVGVLQIHPIMVRDVNRILGYDRWTLQDRWSAAESRAMLEVYLGHYGATSYEEAARKWNGGPDGPSKEATVPYWEKVRRVLENS